MSGGVDSSVTALLMAQQDYDLRAVFMRNWSTMDEFGSFVAGSGGAAGCEWQQDWNDVQKVCRHLGGIPVEMIDLSREYWIHVFEPALGDWGSGTTPNPDVDCNREIKFGALMDRVIGPSSSSQLSAPQKTWLATGHYAQVAWSPPEADADHSTRPMLLRAKDRTKDQSYYLSSVREDRLAHAHFPLAPYLKSEVRQLAIRHELPTAARKESMGICFVGNRSRGGAGFSTFLNDYITSSPGDIVDGDGNKVGRHGGLHTFTLGQGARISGALQKYFVAKKDTAKNQIVVVQGKDNPMLLCHSLNVPSMHWIWDEPPEEVDRPEGAKLLAQVRHRQIEVECTVKRADPVLAVAPGQTLGLWKDDWCLGSGTIGDVKTVYEVEQAQAKDA
ncbi:related to trna methyltransferase [Pseudozyma flocculosa]|uniref:tRNA-5-taurinomethyluridine 2-sulfurtransferase n=1 Tax=Pseudozyma flocculosa TaxID=84751 RepID=A0A5C3EQT9_9BASI|nr:related to trna methyltransferase [Pseudozyma flocculosa]